MTQRRNDWENPRVVGRNKEAAHATSIPYADAAQALRGDRTPRPSGFRLTATGASTGTPTRPSPSRASRTPLSTSPPGIRSRYRRTGS
ncbi:MAG: hypothetical protein R2856_16050 [Caldilineaceae bacterium]